MIRLSNPFLRRSAASLLLLCFGMTVAAAEGFAPSADVERELRHFVEAHRGAPGVVVGLIDASGRRVLAAGVSGRDERPQLDGTTRFEIGSVSKTFTGVLLARMALAGELATDQRVGTLLPGSVVPTNGLQDVTLEQLATHTSGLPRLALGPGQVLRGFSSDPYADSTADEVLRDAATVGRDPDAGRELGYSNLGYATLGQLLAQRAETNWETLVRQRVLQPLGLSGVATGHDAAPNGHVARGHAAGGRPTSWWHAGGYAPAGALVASADDMLQYLTLQLNGKDPAIAEAQRVRKTFADGHAVGLGWLHRTLPGGRRLVWHNGGTGGFRSFVGFLPDEGRALVVLANGQGDVDALARRLIDPTAPALPTHSAGWRAALTLLMLLWGPWVMFRLWRIATQQLAPSPAGGQVPPKRPPPAIDRFDVLRSPITLALVLLLAQRLGDWHTLPFAAWWLSLAASLVLLARLAVQRWHSLPWLQPGRAKLAARVTMTVVELLLVLLWWG